MSATADAPTQAGPFSRFERMVAWRYLRSRRKEAFISVIAGFSFIGIMLGVATLIIVMAVMNGFRGELLERILGINGHLILQPMDRPLDDYEELSKKLSGIAGVSYAIPIVEGQTLASGNRGAGTGALVRGIRPEDVAKVKLVAETVQQGSFEAFAKGEGVAIGSRLAENLGLAAGDKITLISPDGDVTPLGTTPRVKSYPVEAIFQIGMSEYDASIIFMPLAEAQLYFNSEGRVQSIEIVADDPDATDELRPLVELTADRQLLLTDWKERNQTFFLGSSGGAQCHVHDPDADHSGRRAQHHFRPHHAGEGQGLGHCHTAHHGRDARHDHADFPDDRRRHRRHRHIGGRGARHSGVPQH